MFTKAAVAAWLVLTATNANAFPIKNFRHVSLLPPAEFDVPYKGELRIWEVRSTKDMELYCPKALVAATNRAVDRPEKEKWQSTGYACTKPLPSKARCEIYLVKGGPAHPTVTLRHELGHCNGWDANHAGGRKVWSDVPVKVPELPASTQHLRAYPPLVCLTPDGKEESCTDRAKPLAQQDQKPSAQPADP